MRCGGGEAGVEERLFTLHLVCKRALTNEERSNLASMEKSIFCMYYSPCQYLVALNCTFLSETQQITREARYPISFRY